jgi:hypothetical protein
VRRREEVVFLADLSGFALAARVGRFGDLPLPRDADVLVARRVPERGVAAERDFIPLQNASASIGSLSTRF